MIKIPKSPIENPSLLQVTAHNPELHVLVKRERVSLTVMLDDEKWQ